MSSQYRRMYGFFTCDECGRSWESAHVYCNPSVSEYDGYGQQCQSCFNMCEPDVVEELKCPTCNSERCECADGERNIDINKGHRSDLCEKCQSDEPCRLYLKQADRN